jgi:hypothetical protein
MGNPEKIQALKERVASDPFDNTGWEHLLGELSKGRKSDEQAAQLREVYEDLLSKFPTAVGSFILIYCQIYHHAMDASAILHACRFLNKK